MSSLQEQKRSRKERVIFLKKKFTGKSSHFILALATAGAKQIQSDVGVMETLGLVKTSKIQRWP